jgi:GMP synthase (glutamine-hydrolysing)
VNAADLFLDNLKGIEDPEQKRKIIGNTFVDVFNNEASKLDNV